MLKKLLKTNLGLVLATPSLLLVSCGPNVTSINFNDMNNLVAYQNVFAYQDEESQKEIEFSLMPQLKENQNEFLDDDLETATFIMQDNNFLKLNCEKYVCSSVSYKGKTLTYDMYNKFYIDYIETSKVQFSYDNLAKTFNLNISSTDNVFYDFTNNSINVNYSNNLYYFDQYKTGEELVLVSNQDIEFNGEDIFINKIDFYDQTFALTLDFLIELTNNNSLRIDDNSIMGTINDEKEKEIFSQVFANFDNSLKFVVQENEQSDTQTFVADFKNNFKIGNSQILNIKLDLQKSGQEV